MDAIDRHLNSLKNDQLTRQTHEECALGAAKAALNLTALLREMLDPAPAVIRELLALRSEKSSPELVPLPTTGLPERSLSDKGGFFAFDLKARRIVIATQGAGTDRPFPTREPELVDVAHLFTLYQRNPADYSLIELRDRLRG